MIDEKEYGNVLMQCMKDIVALQESLKSYHHRLDDINDLTKSVHELAKNVEKMAVEVKTNTQVITKSIETLQSSSKEQGQRIGAVENDVRELKHFIKNTEKNTERLDKVEREPGERLRTLLFSIISGTVMLFVGYIVSRLLNT